MHTVTRKVITAPSLIAEGRTRPAAGVVVSTAIAAGAFVRQHSEGIVVSTAIAAGGIIDNHSEGAVILTQSRRGASRPITAKGSSCRPRSSPAASRTITAKGCRVHRVTAGGLTDDHSEMLIERPVQE